MRLKYFIKILIEYPCSRSPRIPHALDSFFSYLLEDHCGSVMQTVSFFLPRKAVWKNNNSCVMTLHWGQWVWKQRMWNWSAGVGKTVVLPPAWFYGNPLSWGLAHAFVTDLREANEIWPENKLSSKRKINTLKDMCYFVYLKVCQRK